MKTKTPLIYLFLLTFLGAAMLVYQSDLGGETAKDVADCVRFKESSLSDLSGLLVLESHQDNQPSFILDLGTGEKRELGNLTVNSIVGPSRAGLLTYYDYVIEGWVLVNLKGSVESRMGELEGRTPIAWMDDGKLLVGGDRLQVLELESGEMERVITDSAFSQINENINWSSRLNWDGFSAYRIVPNIDFRYLAYAANGEPGTLLVLWDQQTEEEIARLHWVDTLTPPQWAPDGKSLITSAPPFVLYEGNLFTNASDDLPYIGGNELMQVGVDGSIRRLTTFATEVNAIESAYKWSQDGRHLAFSLHLASDDGESYHAAILDIGSGAVTIFCFPRGVNNIVGFPVWSPNGEKIALTLVSDDRVSHVYIVDAKSGNASSIGLNVHAVGWWGN